MLRLRISRPFASSSVSKRTLFLLPLFRLGVQSYNPFFNLPNLFFLIFNSLTLTRSFYSTTESREEKNLFLIFLADCKDTNPLQFQPNFSGFYFTKIIKPIFKFSCQTFDQKADAKISNHLTTNKLICENFLNKFFGSDPFTTPFDLFSKSGCKDTRHYQSVPNHSEK